MSEEKMDDGPQFESKVRRSRTWRLKAMWDGKVTAAANSAISAEFDAAILRAEELLEKRKLSPLTGHIWLMGSIFIDLMKLRKPSEKQTLPSGLIVSLMLPPKEGEGWLAELEETIYPKWVKRYGVAWAKVCWHVQCIIVAAGHWVGKLAKIAKLLPWVKME